MEELKAGDQVIQFDKERTQTGYAAVSKGSAEQCGCPECQNFAAKRAHAFPPSFRELMERLGVDMTKEGELYDCGDLATYEGWFYFAGAVVEAGERLTVDGDTFHYYFRDASDPEAMKVFGEQVAAVEFQTKLP